MRSLSHCSWPIAAGCLLTLVSAPAQQAADFLSTPSTASSEHFSEVTCTSTNAEVNVDVLQVADDTRDELGPILGLGRQWRFPVHIRLIMPDDPLADQVHEEKVSVNADGGTMSLEVSLPSTEPDLKGQLERQFVTALLWEKFYERITDFGADTHLAIVPTWLVEGLTQWLSGPGTREREAIVRRAVAIQRTPSLAEVQGWNQISDDRLLGMYQSAFCYYLVNGLVHSESQRTDFRNWIAAISQGEAGTPLLTEAAWQAQLAASPQLSHDVVYSWDDSADALTAAQTITVPDGKPEETQSCSLDAVVNFPGGAKFTEALHQKVFELTGLELRAHPSWRPIFATYRFALSALLNGRKDTAAVFIAQAEKRRTQEIAYHQKLTDYMNWFEVTKNLANHTSHFQSYFSTAHSMEQVQADPAKPNPLRSNLNQMESQL